MLRQSPMSDVLRERRERRSLADLDRRELLNPPMWGSGPRTRADAARRTAHNSRPR